MTADPRAVVMAVRSDSFAGVERYVCGVSAELSRRGWRVVVVGGESDAMRNGLGGSIPHLPATTTWQVARAVASLGRCPLVHAHMTAAEVACVLTRPLTRSRVVTTRHFAGLRGKSPLVRIGAAVMARGIFQEIAISRFVADAVEGDPLVLLHGVESRQQRPLPDVRVILVMQRLEAEKDTATAIRAFSMSGLAGEGWVLRIAGRGNDRACLEALARSLDLDSSIEWLGFVEDSEQARQAASVFLATTAQEGFGLSLAEAMSTGLAIVAADGGAHRELLADTGLFFPVGDASACAVRLRQLAGSAEERGRLGQAAAARQQDKLSLSTHVDRLVDAYRGVASRP